MEQLIGHMLFFLTPFFLAFVFFLVKGWKVDYKALFLAILAYGLYVFMVFRAGGAIPIPEFLEGMQFNWLGKTMAIATSLLLVALLPNLNFRAIGATFKQREGSLKPALMVSAGFLAMYWGVVAYFGGGNTYTTEELIWQAIIPGLDEELFFRGIMMLLIFQAFSKNFRILGVDNGLAIVILTTAFGLGHGVSLGEGGLSVHWSTIFFTGTAGFTFAWLRQKTDSLVLPIAVHNVLNVGLQFI